METARKHIRMGKKTTLQNPFLPQHALPLLSMLFAQTRGDGCSSAHPNLSAHSNLSSWDPPGNFLDSLILVLMITISLWSPPALIVIRISGWKSHPCLISPPHCRGGIATRVVLFRGRREGLGALELQCPLLPIYGQDDLCPLIFSVEIHKKAFLQQRQSKPSKNSQFCFKREKKKKKTQPTVFSCRLQGTLSLLLQDV